MYSILFSYTKCEADGPKGGVHEVSKSSGTGLFRLGNGDVSQGSSVSIFKEFQRLCSSRGIFGGTGVSCNSRPVCISV